MMKYIMFLMLGFVLMSCNSFKPTCINDSNKRLTFSFGDFDMKSEQMLNAYQIKSDGKVYKLLNWQGDCASSVFQLSENDYCTLKKKLEDEIMKTQTLNVQADTVRFVQYLMEGTSNRNRAMWNPRYEAIGSKGYREILDYIHSITGIKL